MKMSIEVKNVVADKKATFRPFVETESGKEQAIILRNEKYLREEKLRRAKEREAQKTLEWVFVNEQGIRTAVYK
ncbi:MAG: hypothetical protein M0R38_12515 [Bacteroidia bacterium]|nr:hypothetical protein [Bacteroidia bacterium]